jgi:glycosyltransferase involved in cell wall biosynthesis
MSLIGIQALNYGKALKLYTTHEHWLICPMHVLWKFDREICQTKNCLTCQLKGKRPPQLWRYSRLFEKNLKEIDCLLAPSLFTLKKHLEDGLQIPIRHMPYFLPAPKIGGSQIKNERERPFFLFVGRLERIKGVQNLIPAFRRKSEFVLLIAGDGEYKNELLEQAKDCPNIKFLGRLSPDELQNLYRSAIAVLVPSICFETFGIIIIEAFAQKTPVIVNNLGALPEVVEISGGGLVYQNENELIRAMDLLAGTPRLRQAFGAKGYAAYLKHWNEDAHLKKYLDLIEELRAAKAKTPKSEKVLKKTAAN